MYAACVGPYCYDDTGASINASFSVNSLKNKGSLTAAQISVLAGESKGTATVACSDCVNGMVCVSTGTGVGAYVQVRSTTTACN